MKIKVIKNEDIVIRNLKLLSFRLLSDAMDGGYPVHMIEQKKVIMDSINIKPKVPNAGVLLKALEQSDLMTTLHENVVTRLF